MPKPSKWETGRHDAGPLRSNRLVARLGLKQTERRALRVAHDPEAAARKVLRRNHLARAQLCRLLERLVDVSELEVGPPVARYLGGDHGGHLHAAGDALSVDLELDVLGHAFLPAHLALMRRPTEDLLVEVDRFVDAARVELRPAERVRGVHDLRALHLARLPCADERSRR